MLSNQWFSLIVIKVSQGVANNQFIVKKNKSPEIHHFVDNSGRFSDIMAASVKLSKYQSL